MKTHRLFATLLALSALGSLESAEKVVITATHRLDLARPSETLTVPWSEINRVLPGALVQKIAVRDSSGRTLPYQVTNVAPQAKDPKGEGIAYGELIFQHDFAAGEKSATFTVERTEQVTPPFPVKAFARHVPERLDDFAWENDKVAHRTYGPALAAPVGATPKEVLVTSGLDVWCKRVDYPIVDRWYNKGHDHYHTDQGEGMDMYQVGPSRGCGGTGVWDGKALHVGRNYASSRIIANGPIRAVFELSYDTWMANGVMVSEVKRFTVDAGHYLDLIESTFQMTGAKEAVVGVGLNKNPADRGQEARIDTKTDPAGAAVTQWIEQKTNGALGTAVVIVSGGFQGFAEDDRNQLALARVAAGESLRYLAGAGWSRRGDFADAAAWRSYVENRAARARAPVSVTVAAR
jgi:hypothetical protein